MHVGSGAPSHVLRGCDAAVQCACFDPTGSFLVSGDQQGHVAVWRMRTRRVLDTKTCAHATTWEDEASLRDGLTLLCSACDAQEGVLQVQSAPGETWIRCATRVRRPCDEARAHVVLTCAVWRRCDAFAAAKGGGERSTCGDGGRTRRWNGSTTMLCALVVDSASLRRPVGNDTSTSHGQVKLPEPSTCGISTNGSKHAASKVREATKMAVQACA